MLNKGLPDVGSENAVRIYKKVKDEAYGGIRLQTIEFYGP